MVNAHNGPSTVNTIQFTPLYIIILGWLKYYSIKYFSYKFDRKLTVHSKKKY